MQHDTFGQGNFPSRFMAAVRGRPSGLPEFGCRRFANPRTAATLFVWRRSEAVFLHSTPRTAPWMKPWFSARDLGRLLRLFLDERALRKLDPDQHQNLQMLIHGTVENTLLISESGVYALLVYHYCPEYRGLREWLTHNVVPALRDAQQSASTERPFLSLLNWPEMSLSLLHWNNQPWIRLQDVPQLLPNEERPRSPVNAPWWKRASRVLQSF